MDMERARAELGLAEEFTRDELRRAYLRAVRKHPPERDPEGFQRVRQAQELLQFVSARLSLAHVAPVPSAPEPPSAAPEPPSAEPDPQPPPASDEADEPHFTAGEDPVQDARAMIAALDSPPQETSYPPPYICFVTTLLLLADGRVELARKLWESFDRRARAEGWGARDLSPELAARREIVRESIALAGRVPSTMTQALARATLQGRYFTAANAVETALATEGGSIKDVFEHRAPTLYAAVWPAVNASSMAQTEQAASFRTFPWWTILIVFVLFSRLLSGAGSCSRASSTRYTSVPTPPVAYKPTTTSEPDPVDLSESKIREIAGVSAAVDRALAENDCQTVREQWPLYLAAMRGAPDSEQEPYLRRLVEARLRCSELEEILENKP